MHDNTCFQCILFVLRSYIFFFWLFLLLVIVWVIHIRKQFATLLIVSAIDNAVNALKEVPNIPSLYADSQSNYFHLALTLIVSVLYHHHIVYYFIIIIKLFALIRFCCLSVVVVVVHIAYVICCVSDKMSI